MGHESSIPSLSYESLTQSISLNSYRSAILSANLQLLGQHRCAGSVYVELLRGARESSDVGLRKFVARVRCTESKIAPPPREATCWKFAMRPRIPGWKERREPGGHARLWWCLKSNGNPVEPSIVVAAAANNRVDTGRIEIRLPSALCTLLRPKNNGLRSIGRARPAK